MRHFLSMTLLIILFSCASQETQVAEKKADLFFNNGTSHLIKRNYTSALTQLLKAVKLAPERSDIHNNLAMAYFFKKDKRNCLKHLKYSLKLDPKNNDARMNIANLYIETKKYDKAQKELKRILKDLTYTKQYKTYYNLGLIELKKKNIVQAKDYFSEAIKENSSACSAHFQLAMMEYKNKNYKLALEKFKDAGSGVCYRTIAPIYYQAQVYTKLNKFQIAKLKYMEIIDKFPRSKYAKKSKKEIKNIATMDVYNNDQYFSKLEMSQNQNYIKDYDPEKDTEEYKSPSFK